MSKTFEFEITRIENGYFRLTDVQSKEQFQLFCVPENDLLNYITGYMNSPLFLDRFKGKDDLIVSIFDFNYIYVKEVNVGGGGFFAVVHTKEELEVTKTVKELYKLAADTFADKTVTQIKKICKTNPSFEYVSHEFENELLEVKVLNKGNDVSSVTVHLEKDYYRTMKSTDKPQLCDLLDFEYKGKTYDNAVIQWNIINLG